MTSTPTACPECGKPPPEYPTDDYCRCTRIYKPHQPSRCPKCKRPYDDARLTPGSLACSCQPDTSAARDRHIEAFKLTTYKGPLDSYISGYDTGYAQATAQMGAEIEQLRVQLAGCGVAAMQNTERSKADRAKPCDYGWSASYSDVCAAVDREIALREQLVTAQSEIERLNREYADDHSGDCDIPAVKHLRWQLSALQAKCDAYEKEIAHALRYLRESGAGDERLRGEPEFEMLESFEQVLAAHNRPTKEAADE